MNRVKLYRIFAIANNLKKDITYMSGTKSDKLQEIKDLCEEINNEQEYKF
tara:strand:+ start:614 stop:763 length:150 start_codon:yes stop_codon:yes gene_type:complete